MEYEIQVQYKGHSNLEWKHYAPYATLNEALREFHRLETNEAVANVRVCRNDEQVCIAQ